MNFWCFGSGKRKKRNNLYSPGQSEDISLENVRLFPYKVLRSATGNFQQTNQLGRGGFGVVYKGVLKDGTQVAVKTLSANSAQGTREFLTEIKMISSVLHPNLVQLIGCCIEGRDRMLVYEYMENNSLASVLLGPRSNRTILDWSKRVVICVGTAQGLAFLHEESKPHIVHRDIKASNILLDKDLNPKIGDFGLAKLFPDNVTHVSTRVAGTMGYLAPEYALLGQLTRKADIYSFGVLLLEIISGRSSSNSAWGEDMMLLLEWTWKLRDEGNLLDIVDPQLVDYPEVEVLRFIKVALFCTQAASHHRPSMKQVVQMLSNEVDLNVKMLTKPDVYKTSSNENTATTSLKSPQVRDGKQSMFGGMMKSFASITQMQPR
ncbi:Cold-responsive protein kinase [Thalictrum thalictroides]|uniref:Cold-responsive protein kinase n=1 Tax=Thalictrum thalictroides TaxID=46969 RepID=A0A7J6XEA9_THATH|nr:Cold-responsive protein kinase [Thalictrum thalictroides]